MQKEQLIEKFMEESGYTFGVFCFHDTKKDYKHDWTFVESQEILLEFLAWLTKQKDYK